MVHSLPLRTKVFISYSHKDAKYAEQLIEHLAYDKRYNLIETWGDKKLMLAHNGTKRLNKRLISPK
jgi:hypothetical protein